MASNESDVPSACQEIVLGVEADTTEPFKVETSSAAWRKIEENQEKDVREMYNGDDRGTYRYALLNSCKKKFL